MTHIHNLFAVELIQTKLLIDTTLHKKILDWVNDNFEKEKKNRFLSLVNGMQHHGDFPGKKEINKKIEIEISKFGNYRLASSWLNVLDDKSYNLPHAHLGAEIVRAGVFYLSVGNENINFTKDGDVFTVEPKLFDLLIFPFDLVHYVLPSGNKNKRVCLAFNIEEIT